MLPGDKLSFSFDVKAMYPVKAKGTSSRAYAYYNPEIKGEVLSQGIVVVSARQHLRWSGIAALCDQDASGDASSPIESGSTSRTLCRCEPSSAPL